MTTTPTTGRPATGTPPARRRQPVRDTSLGAVLFALLMTLLIAGIGGTMLLNALLGTG